jgi:hypothetical protein
MRTGRLLSVVFGVILAFGLAGCNSSSSDSSDDTSSTTTDTSSTTSTTPATYATSVAEKATSYSADDVVDKTTFDYSVLIDFTGGTAQLSTAEVKALPTETGKSITFLTVDSTSVALAKTTYGYTITSTISSKVAYKLSGTLNGTLTVNSSGVYELYLNNVAVSATAGPALDLESTQKAFIVLPSGTTNTLSDATTSSTMKKKGALYGMGPLVFSGDGTLHVTGNYKHGIFGNDYIRIRAGVIGVTATVKNGIHAVNGFIFDDGQLTINGTGTTVDDESKGIKVEGSETTGTGKGYIVINGGYLTITSVGKAITAGWDIDEDATTTSTADDPDPYVEINAGVLTLTTTGAPYEYTQNGTTYSCSPEGVEGKTKVTINNGYLMISTTDDAINAGTNLTINGGIIYAASSKNDAIDSNGNLTIAGGVIVAIGTAAPEGSFDYGDDVASTKETFTISGGTFVGIGGTTAQPSSVTQNTVVLGSLSSGTTMGIKSSSGTTIFAFTIPQSYATMILSSPKITTGTQYTIYTGGTATADKTFKGLYFGTLSYTGGSSASTFTASSGITKLGGQYF